jgi:hypothetical protein
VKKIVLLLGLLGLWTSSAKAVDVWQSSSTKATVGVLTPLCAGPTSYAKRAFLHGVCTDFAVASASMTVWNSSWTQVGNSKFIETIDAATNTCRYYDTDFPNGLSFLKNNAAGVTILFRCQ